MGTVNIARVEFQRYEVLTQYFQTSAKTQYHVRSCLKFKCAEKET